MPSPVIWRLAEFLDTTSWRIACGVFPRWKQFPPPTLTLSGVPELETLASTSPEDELLACLPERVRFSKICGDRIYGGPTTHGTSICQSVTRLVSRRPDIFLHVVRIDMLGQLTAVTQLVELFSETNADRFPALQSAAFRIFFRSHSPSSATTVSKPPPNLHTLEIYPLDCTTHQMRLPLMPLLCHVRHLTWITDVSSIEEFSNYPRLISLETGFSSSIHEIRKLMPNLRKLKEHISPRFIGCSNKGRTLSFSCNLCRSGPISTAVRRIFSEIESVFYPKNSVISGGTHNYYKKTMFNLNNYGSMGSPQGFVDKLERFALPFLTQYSQIDEVTLPPEILTSWSICSSVRPKLRSLASTYSFPGVRRLQFGELHCDECEVYGSLIDGEIVLADGLLSSFLQMFPNLEELVISAIPFFQGIPSYLALEKILPRLRKLCIAIAYCKTPGPSRWLPHCKRLDVLILNTSWKYDWREERQSGYLMRCLARNQTLRFVLILVDGPGRRDLPSEHELARLAKRWAHRNWRCVLFLITNKNHLMGMVKNKQGFQRYTFIWQKFEEFFNVYPELYSVLFKEYS